MTIAEYITKYLVDRGMFESQAAQVLDATKKATPAMEERRWNESVDDYPRTLTAGLILTAKDEALKWIDANLPRAWFRPMFSESAR